MKQPTNQNIQQKCTQRLEGDLSNWEAGDFNLLPTKCGEWVLLSLLVVTVEIHTTEMSGPPRMASLCPRQQRRLSPGSSHQSVVDENGIFCPLHENLKSFFFS